VTRSLALALALCFCAPSASAFQFPWSKDKPFESVQELYAREDYGEVAAKLSEPGLRRISRGNRAKAYKMLGVSLERLGKTKEALAVYQYAETLYPEDLNILSGLANLLHRVDLDDRARPLFERVLSIHPNNAEAHLGMAEILARQGLLERAQRHYESALSEWNRNPEIWRDYALLLGQRRDWAGAVAAVRQALALQESAASYEALALFQRASGEPEAYSSLTRAIGMTQDRPDMRLRAALWLLEDGRLDECLQAADSLLAADPEEPLALWLRASVSLRRGRFESARGDLEKAAQHGRRAPFVARVSQALLERLPR